MYKWYLFLAMAAFIACAYCYCQSDNKEIKKNENEKKEKVNHLNEALINYESRYDSLGVKVSGEKKVIINRTEKIIKSDKEILKNVLINGDTSFFVEIRQHIKDFENDFGKPISNNGSSNVRRPSTSVEENCTVLRDSSKVRLESEKGIKVGTTVKFRIRKTIEGCHSVHLKLKICEDNVEDIIRRLQAKKIRDMGYIEIVFERERVNNREFFLIFETNERKSVPIQVEN